VELEAPAAPNVAPVVPIVARVRSVVACVFASNGYSLFTIETLSTITHLPNNERLGEVSRRWKKLSEDKKEAYNLKAEEVSFNSSNNHVMMINVKC